MTEGRKDGPVPESGARWGRALQVMRRVTGMPDYAGYVSHMAERHPACPVLSEGEFFAEYLQARYGSGVSRCC